jgi:hypothetical protein
MGVLSVLSVCAMSLFLEGAGLPGPNLGELHYRATIRFRADQTPVVTRFVLMLTPVAATHNKVKKPRLGGWRIEAVQRKEDTFAYAPVLARVEKLLYFSGPAPNLIQKPIFIRYEGKRCQVWQVRTPSTLPVYAYLVETVPGILALSYFSGSFDAGELASVELQLEGFELRPEVAPAENGMILLTTLQRLSMAIPEGEEVVTESVE